MNSNELLERYIHNLVSEVLRKFNFNYFKNITDLNEMIMYARQTLPLLGEGSSRITFAYSGGKVLKIALNDRGLSQNAAELKVWNNSAAKNAVTEIYNSKGDGDKVYWLISQIAKTLKSKEEFKQLTGFDFETYVEIIDRFAKGKASGDILTVVKNLSNEYEKRILFAQKENDKKTIAYYENKKEELDFMIKTPFFNGVIAAMAISRVMSGDIKFLDHYGRTIDGKVVLLDSGFTEEVYQKHISYYSQDASNQQSGAFTQNVANPKNTSTMATTKGNIPQKIQNTAIDVDMPVTRAPIKKRQV